MLIKIMYVSHFESFDSEISSVHFKVCHFLLPCNLATTKLKMSYNKTLDLQGCQHNLKTATVYTY